MKPTADVAGWTLSWAHGAPVYKSRAQVLEAAVRASMIGGLFCEFGVYEGGSLRFIADMVGSHGTVYGFDSFQGLPASSPGTERGDWPQGAFRHAPPSDLPPNVRIYPGWFTETLPKFVAEVPGWASFLHCDADLYDSTVTVLTEMAPKIVRGTVLLFDEFLWWPGWAERGEARAWAEFVERTGTQFRCIGLVEGQEQVAVRVE